MDDCSKLLTSEAIRYFVAPMCYTDPVSLPRIPCSHSRCANTDVRKTYIAVPYGATGNVVGECSQMTSVVTRREVPLVH